MVGICYASYVWSYQLASGELENIKQLFSSSLCITDEHFWELKSNSVYATLIKVAYVTPITPFEVNKQDRRGWVVWSRASEQMVLL